jgi:hypothetical protein
MLPSSFNDVNQGSPGSRPPAMGERVQGQSLFSSRDQLLALQASAFASRDISTSQLNSHHLLANISKRVAEESAAEENTFKKHRAGSNIDERTPAPSWGRGDQSFLGRGWGTNTLVEPSSPYQMLGMNNTSNAGLSSPPAGSANFRLQREALLRAELSAQIIQQEHAARNAALLASLTRPQVGNNNFMPGGQFNSGWPASLQDSLRLQEAARSQLQAQLADFRFASTGLSNSMNAAPSANSNSFLFGAAPAPQHSEDLQSVLSRLSSAGLQQRAGGVFQDYQMAPTPSHMPSEQATTSSQQLTSSLPPCDGGIVVPFTQRPKYPLGIEEDQNWLSEFHCFVRSELVEVYRASQDDCKARNNSIGYQQVGIRCRFCAHAAPSARAGRSSAFPSSLRQLYQSFTMMLRDHFGKCDAMPSHISKLFDSLKDKPSQGATDSKRFWVYSAMKIGMSDSPTGIAINEMTIASGAKVPPFGTSPDQQWADDAVRSIQLILPSDRTLVSEFMCSLMSHVQLVRITEAERIGNRRSLQAGLPGFGCRYCCESRRLGLCRVFPARRRTLPGKINDLHDHMRRCTLCPVSVKERLEHLHQEMNRGGDSDREDEKEFFDRIWTRIGHGNRGKTEL